MTEQVVASNEATPPSYEHSFWIPHIADVSLPDTSTRYQAVGFPLNSNRTVYSPFVITQTPWKGRTVLIAEPDMSGHHPDAALFLMQWFLGQGAKVVWGTFEDTNPPNEPEWEEIVPQIERVTLDRVARKIEKWGATGNLFHRQYGWWWWYREMDKLAKATYKIDLTVVAYANSMDKMAGLLGSPFKETPWACMSMRDSFHHQAMGLKTPRRKQDGPAEWLFKRTVRSKSLKAFLTLDPTLETWSHKHLGEAGKKVITYPDIATPPANPLSKPEARAALGIADRPTISLVGSIEPRKGVGDALKAIEELPEFQLLLAGRFVEECKEMVAAPSAQKLIAEGQLICIDRRISNDELQWAIEAADVIWAMYDGHYFPSNVLSQAAAFDRPLLGTDQGLIGDRVRAKNLGKIASVGDIQSQVQSIRDLNIHSETYNDDLAAYAASQSPEAFSSALARAFGG